MLNAQMDSSFWQSSKFEKRLNSIKKKCRIYMNVPEKEIRKLGM